MRSIATRLGISRNTVAKAVSADGPPTCVRAPQDSGIKAVEPVIRALLRDNRGCWRWCSRSVWVGPGPGRGSGRTWPGYGRSMLRQIPPAGSVTNAVTGRNATCGSRRSLAVLSLGRRGLL